MKVNVRTLLLSLAGLTLAGLLAAWLVSATEWYTHDVWDPPTGEAARDPKFLLKRLATRLGAQVEVRHQLNELPPEGGTLLLETINWRFMPEREAALRAWVERGGHLVAFQEVASPAGATQAVGGWLPVSYVRVKRLVPTAKAPAATASAASPDSDQTTGQDEDDEDLLGDDDEMNAEEDEPVSPGESASSAASAPPASQHAASTPRASGDGKRQEPACVALSEPDDQPGWFGAPRSYDACARSVTVLKTALSPLWSVSDDKGLRAARLALGRGTLTLSTQWEAPRGSLLQDDDEALLSAAILQLRPGQKLWILDDTRHAGLFATLWRAAPAACALAALALLLVWWRWSIRFAPLRAPDTLARRSITAQVHGTAAYLLRHGPAALHRAQLRALEEAALAHVPGWRRLSAERRIGLLAHLCGLPAAELAQACNPVAPGDPRAAGRALGLMEAARRRIAELGLRSPRPEAAADKAPPPPSSPKAPPNSPPSA